MAWRLINQLMKFGFNFQVLTRTEGRYIYVALILPAPFQTGPRVRLFTGNKVAGA